MAESTEKAVKIVLGIDDSENSERAFQCKYEFEANKL